MDHTQQSDAELAGLAGGTGEAADHALSALLGRYARRLHRYFSMQFGEMELARDLVQEVFERVLKARARMPEDEGFRPWVWTIAINLAHNTRRRRGSSPLSVSLEESPGEVGQPLRDRVASGEPGPRELLARDERRAGLLRAVDLLEPAQRDVILLKFFQELPCAEVAQALGISEGTVWSRTHRALERLRGLLGSDSQTTGEQP